MAIYLHQKMNYSLPSISLIPSTHNHTMSTHTHHKATCCTLPPPPATNCPTRSTHNAPSS